MDDDSKDKDSKPETDDDSKDKDYKTEMNNDSGDSEDEKVSESSKPGEDDNANDVVENNPYGLDSESKENMLMDRFLPDNPEDVPWNFTEYIDAHGEVVAIQKPNVTPDDRDAEELAEIEKVMKSKKALQTNADRAEYRFRAVINLAVASFGRQDTVLDCSDGVRWEGERATDAKNEEVWPCKEGTLFLEFDPGTKKWQLREYEGDELREYLKDYPDPNPDEPCQCPVHKKRAKNALMVDAPQGATRNSMSRGDAGRGTGRTVASSSTAPLSDANAMLAHLRKLSDKRKRHEKVRTENAEKIKQKKYDEVVELSDSDF